MTVRCALALLLWLITALSAWSAPPPTPPELEIKRSQGAIELDGDLSDPGWRDAVRVETWFETNVGENADPPARSVGFLAYDDAYFYAGFDFSDPHPERIRAPYNDRDVLGQDTDYGGIILDPRHDGRTGVLLLANPRGVQYDAVNDDATGNEDSSPDFFWNAAARLTPTGWQLELRVPFSSLRYPSADPRTWGIMLYRNWPREFRYQMFSTTLPRGSSCFICRSNTLRGLSGLPTGRSLVLAPYANARRTDAPRAGLGSPLASGPLRGDLGLDLKWLPSVDHALDATLNPDFSQIESDTAQIAANERFALFFPEKRPFFLEGVELLSTPVQALYTRTLTAPRWGTRATGKAGATAYTALVAQDEGGGSVILPRPNGSAFAPQDFRSLAGVARVRHDLSRSFVSLLGSTREVDGGGHNRVLGPDFQWRKSDGDVLTGQLLWSDTRTPRRPDLADEWDGRRLNGHALDLAWSHNRRHYDLWTQVRDYGRGFRADNGFVPQVGYRQASLETGWTFRPTGFLRRLRAFVILDRSTDRGGGLLFQRLSAGAGMNGRFNSFLRLHAVADRVRAQERVLPRRQLLFDFETNPTRLLSGIGLRGFVGQEIDFAQARRGRGASLAWRATLRAGDHVELRYNGDRRFLDLDLPGGARARLFDARIDRLRATYTFTPRAFVRAVGQYVETRRDPNLYADARAAKSGGFSGSLLFAYKLDWQTVLFVGYGDERALDDDGSRLERASRQAFVKLSYAWQL
jgi:hypothetical protein